MVAAALTSAVFEQLQADWAASVRVEAPQHAQQQANRLEQQQQQQQQQQQPSRWLPPLPPHTPLLARATEPSIEERFANAGIDVALLNQPGGAHTAGRAAVQQQQQQQQQQPQDAGGGGGGAEVGEGAE
jgi:hypothetical protein